VHRPPEAEDPWASASWAGAEAAGLALGARMTLPERLAWLEAMSRLARTLGAPSSTESTAFEPAERPGETPMANRASTGTPRARS
jgi:hypothetical protein